MMVASSTVPMSPLRMRFSSAAKFGSKRRLKPIIKFDLFFSTTLRQLNILSTDNDTGFSQRMALPAFDAASIRSACVPVGVAIRIASTSFDAMISSTLAVFAPTVAARSLAAFATASAT